jgi:hypothetical protein
VSNIDQYIPRNLGVHGLGAARRYVAEQESLRASINAMHEERQKRRQDQDDARDASVELLGRLVSANQALGSAIESQAEQAAADAAVTAALNSQMLFWARVAAGTGCIGLVIAVIPVLAA